MGYIATLILFLIFPLGSTGWAMSKLPEGTWSGSGFNTDIRGKVNHYTATVTVRNNNISKVFHLSGKVFRRVTSVTLDANGFGSADVKFFDDTGKEHDEGKLGVTCGEAHCSYWSNERRFDVTETYSENSLAVFGSENEKGLDRRWEETLHRK